MSTLHDTFRHIQAIQEFDTDVVIAELKRLRDAHMGAAESEIERARSCIADGTAVGGINFMRKENLFATLYKYNNAVVVAEKLKELGYQTLKMDTGKDLTEEVLALAAKHGPDALPEQLRSGHIQRSSQQEAKLA